VHGVWLEKTIMPSHLKELVRARMEKTGERYEQALRRIRAQEGRAAAAQSPPEAPYSKSAARALSVADTAFSIAVVRAEESLRPAAERLFDDPYASIFAASGAHAAEATQRYLDLPFFRDGVRLRTRFIDDFVRDGLASGLAQVVLLGAGFDSRGPRMPEIAKRRVSVFEVDIPSQLQRKRSVLASAGVKVPARVAYVPFDFDAQDLDGVLLAALEAKGFRRGASALFVWEGVIGYIDDAAIGRSLRFMANAGGPRSQLVFTFGQGSFEPETAAERTRRTGFSSCEEIAGDELWRRYLPGDPHPIAWVMKIGTAMV
jgi:methyltransferase (TIGR00027 family)